MSPSHPSHGFYAILDTGYVDEAAWEAKARALLAGGARLLQIRAKDRSAEEVRRLVEQVLPLTRAFAVPLIINDHLDLALAFPDTGLHLGQDDGDVREARRLLGRDRILGLSTHSLDQARDAVDRADVLSYFAVGPVFPTGTKPDYQPVGLHLVSQVRALQPALPFFCIGGINRQNLEQLIQAGARGVVAVSDPLLDPDTESATREFTHRLEAGARA